MYAPLPRFGPVQAKGMLTPSFTHVKASAALRTDEWRAPVAPRPEVPSGRGRALPVSSPPRSKKGATLLGVASVEVVANESFARTGPPTHPATRIPSCPEGATSRFDKSDTCNTDYPAGASASGTGVGITIQTRHTLDRILEINAALRRDAVFVDQATEPVGSSGPSTVVTPEGPNRRLVVCET
jgi:hypothetical protein